MKLLLFFFLVSQLWGEVVEEFVFENPPFASCHASTITETHSGKLLCAYYGGSQEGASDVAIWLSIRNAQGWTTPRLIAQGEGVACWNPVLFTLPSGEILLFYKVGPAPSSWSAVLKRSYDEGESWSSGEELPAGIIGPVKNKPLLLEDGTLLCGSSMETWHRWGCWIDISSDQGISWSKSRPINLKDDLFGIIQPTLFFTPDRKLRMLTRSRQAGYICTATSEDQGKTWTEAVPTNLPNPSAGIDAVQLDNKNVLLVYNNSFTKRTPLNVALSQDGGVDWFPLFTLEDAPGEYSYPSVIQTRDHAVHIVYTFNRVRIKHVVFVPLVDEPIRK